MTALRIGLLGAARITPAAVIDPARTLDQVEVTCIGARSLGSAQEFAKKHAIPEAFEGYDAVVTSGDVDLVYVALPIAAHCEWAIAAANAGKHVLVEKSFAMDAVEAEAMIEAGKVNGVRVVEAYHYRFHPAFSELLRLIHEGSIGAITTIEGEFSAPIPCREGEIRHDPALGGGALRDLGCYPLHWILSLVPDPIVCIDAQASFTSARVDETLTADLSFANGITARLRTSMAPEKERRRHLVIQGSNGSIEFENPLAPHDGSRIRVNGREVATYDTSSKITYFHQLDTVNKAIATGQSLPTELDSILRQQRAIDAIFAAVEN